MNEIVSTPGIAVPDFWLMMLKSAGMLCLVIALLVGVLFIIRHISEKQNGKINKSLIKLLASFHVAPKEQLMLVDVMGRKILIGVTQQSINCLSVFDDDCHEKENETTTNSGFPGVLEKISQLQLETDAEEASGKEEE